MRIRSECPCGAREDPKGTTTAQVTLRRSSGGVFEIRIDGRIAYSKAETGRFPTEAEIVDCLE